MRRLVSLTHANLAATRLMVQCLDGGCTLELLSPLRPAVIAEGDPNDPRNAAGKDRRLLCTRTEAQDNVIAMQQKTKNTGFTVNCAVEHRGEIPFTVEEGEDSVLWHGQLRLKSGDSAILDKSICYTVSGKDEPDAWREALEGCRRAPRFEILADEQRDYLDAFWKRAGIQIEGDDALLQGLRFNLFHLLQSVGRDGRRNIAAKGLTGEGYEGHTFWDTEAYILPVFLYTEPELAKKLLQNRFSILPKARERARVMGHPIGALFPWRTIDGEECSAYFPAGTAQVHIDGDIAHAVWEYWQATRDLDFLAENGAEILIETARLYYDLGFFSSEKGGRFVINCVTGPDEYNVMVNNNVYTNSVAEENLRTAAAAVEILQAERPQTLTALAEKIGLRETEPADWLKAADSMYYPPAQDGIVPQDDGFLERKPWPLDSIPAENHPLLMHYHGLTDPVRGPLHRRGKEEKLRLLRQCHHPRLQPFHGGLLHPGRTDRPDAEGLRLFPFLGPPGSGQHPSQHQGRPAHGQHGGHLDRHYPRLRRHEHPRGYAELCTELPAALEILCILRRVPGSEHPRARRSERRLV